MRIADFCRQDTGGQSFRCAQAVRTHTPHESHSFCRSSDYLGFPAEIVPGHDPEWVRSYLGSVDVVHVHGKYRAANGWATINPDAKWVIHQHGRTQIVAERAADEKRGALRVVSTLNLLPDVDGDAGRWIPAPLDLPAYDALPKAEHAGYRISHSPTNRAYKSTDLFLACVAELKAEGVDVEAVVIEGVSHEECLAIKAGCDDCFDQMHLCYGSSDLQAMALSDQVMVGMSWETHLTVKQVTGQPP